MATDNPTSAGATTNTGIAGDLTIDGNANERIDHDQLFKLLITEFFTQFLTLFLSELAAEIEPGSIEFLDKELYTDLAAGYSHEADIVVKVRFRGQPAFFIIHVENQSKPQLDFDRRMFWYFARLYEKFGLPVYPIVVFSYDTPQKKAVSRHDIRIAGLDVLRFRYRVVQLNRYSWRSFLKSDNPAAVALMAKMKIARRDRPKVKAACMALIGGLPLNDAQKRLLAVFVDTYLRLDDREEQQYRRELAKLGPQEEQNVMVLDDIVTSWELRGRAEGRQEGIAEGLQQGETRIISRLLAQRFGSLPDDLQLRINTLDAGQLEALSLELLNFTDIGQVRAWLDSYA